MLNMQLKLMFALKQAKNVDTIENRALSCPNCFLCYHHFCYCSDIYGQCEANSIFGIFLRSGNSLKIGSFSKTQPKLFFTQWCVCFTIEMIYFLTETKWIFLKQKTQRKQPRTDVLPMEKAAFMGESVHLSVISWGHIGKEIKSTVTKYRVGLYEEYFEGPKEIPES